MKKIVSAILAAAFAAGAVGLVSCGGGQADYDPDNFLTQAQAEELYGNPYRIVKEPVKIKIFVPRGSMNPYYSSMKMFKKLSEVTNLEFEFKHADTSSYINERNQAWLNNDLPDFFLFSNTVSEQVIYSERNMLVAFNDPDLSAGGVAVGSLIDNYMPVYKELLDDNFNIETSIDAKSVVTMKDGKIYAAVTANDVPRDRTYKMWINEKWIKNVNEYFSVNLKRDFGVDALPLPDDVKTVDDLLLVLRAFKKYDANLNDNPSDEIPVSSLAMQYLRNFLIEAYGAVSNGVEINAAGTEFGYTPITEAYRKYLETARTMYSEGLMDNGTFSNKETSQMASKGYDDRLGVFCSAAAYLVSSYKYEDDFKAFGPLTSDYYTGTPVHLGFSPFTAGGAVIPRGTPYVREIARLLDIMYSDLGVQLISYGEEGVDWTWDDDEKTSWTFRVPSDWDKTQEEYRATISPNVGTGAALYWQYDFVGKMNDDIIRKLNRESERYTPYLKVPVPEDVILDKDDYEPVSRLLVDLSKYIEMTEYNFITGDGGYDIFNDSSWNSYVGEVRSRSCDQVVARYNAALKGRK